ncbi:glycine-rich domain-containing protein [Streptomyces smyrnaeus]|uniref:glycine-rich domain-containing protein n=1 Tax=Streptomyces smyrnaeus TaxID=1387713 RepID=UPI00368C4937
MSAEPDNTATLDPQGCVHVPLPKVEMTAEMVVYEADGTFDPAAYPGLQYVRVRAVGGGGGSVGAGPVTYGSTIAVGSSGGAGSYAESVLTAAQLPAGPIPVWVGDGGAGAPYGQNAGNGTLSSFGGDPTPPLTGLVVALWGLGGGSGNDPSQPGTNIHDAKTFMGLRGSPNLEHSSPVSSIGQLVIPGGAGDPSWGLGEDVLGPGSTLAIGGTGGTTPLSGRVAGEVSIHRGGGGAWAQGISTFSGNLPYGTGGAAPVSRIDGTAAEPDGYDGAPGVVIVEVVQLTVTAA